MNKLFGLTLLLLMSVAKAASFSFAAIGDVPYGAPKQLEQLARQLNQQSIAFTVHVGDIKSGSSSCSDEYFLTVRELFDRFEQPLIYTPGDNEWTDCHRKSCGAYDPLERLEKIRSLFFSTNESLGHRRLPLQVQSSEPRFSKFVENRRWAVENISFATLHLVGSNNNWQPELPSVAEFAEREAANIAWLRETFDYASRQQHVAVVLAMQADTFMSDAGAGIGLAPWLQALREEVVRWNKPVLLIQGDTHMYRVDQPLKDNNGQPLRHLMRVVVPGERDIDAVMVDVNPHNPREPFRVRRLFLTAAPAR